MIIPKEARENALLYFISAYADQSHTPSPAAARLEYTRKKYIFLQVFIFQIAQFPFAFHFLFVIIHKNAFRS